MLCISDLLAFALRWREGTKGPGNTSAPSLLLTKGPRWARSDRQGEEAPCVAVGPTPRFLARPGLLTRFYHGRSRNVLAVEPWCNLKGVLCFLAMIPFKSRAGVKGSAEGR